MTLLEQARDYDRRGGWEPEGSEAPPQFTEEQYALTVAYLRGQVSTAAYRQALKANLASPQYLAWRILREGVGHWLVVVDVCPPAHNMLPRLCDGALTEDVA